MKFKYEEPTIEVVLFDNEDIVTVSTGSDLEIDVNGLENDGFY